MKNNYGVECHDYELTLADGRNFVMNVGDECDWSNVRRVFTDWNPITGTHTRPCVGWGIGNDAGEWVEVVEVVDCASITKERIDPLTWAQTLVWPLAKNYCE